MSFPIRLRHPRGVTTISVTADTTIEQLKIIIFGESEVDVGEMEIKYSYPPKPLPPQLSPSTPISAIPITRGETLVVTRSNGSSTADRNGSVAGIGNVAAGGSTNGAGQSRMKGAENGGAGSRTSITQNTKPTGQSSSNTSPGSASSSASAPKTTTSSPLQSTRIDSSAPKSNLKPPTISAQQASIDADAAFAASLQEEYNSPLPTTASSSSRLPQQSSTKAKDSSPTSIPLGNGQGTLLHRIVPDDNSCLFSSIGVVFKGGYEGGVTRELRQVVADAIRKDPITYSDVVLGRPREEYIQTILQPNSWGGAIELAVFAKHFKTEIDSFDVQSGRADKFGEGEWDSRCLLVYSGIHYDALTTSPLPSFPPEFHTTIFYTTDSTILPAATQLIAKLKEKRYFTDVANFDLRCGVCGVGLKGEKGAREHAKGTGHVEFGEY